MDLVGLHWKIAQLKLHAQIKDQWNAKTDHVDPLSKNAQLILNVLLDLNSALEKVLVLNKINFVEQFPHAQRLHLLDVKMANV